MIKDEGKNQNIIIQGAAVTSTRFLDKSLIFLAYECKTTATTRSYLKVEHYNKVPLAKKPAPNYHNILIIKYIIMLWV